MNLRLPAFILNTLFLAITLGACSMYTSTGRKNFENRAPGNLVNTSSTKTHLNSSPDSVENFECWNQLATEPLWHVEDDVPLSVTKINDDEIQVCLQTL